ncbi:protein adenylyltransferase SelO family protein [Lichenifustis flavocetrariae]|uniref:Protein nucleotidyltransferase YdiU n=1 Tax=Lichenifustis flavocetrariae TaxID=2949735 RepID=A0AA41YUK8_9HYPH|nr:YdiU family protein [Lichenifustis flavocetrariae]MCW6507605.1 YdiU family protein [Lichenifustis flavocetrariae]
MPFQSIYRPSTQHAALGSDFYDVVRAASFPRHVIRYRNQRAARQVGLDTLTDAEWIAHFGRFEAMPGSFPEPLALRYHGHQFGSYNPELGDGRGFLFAQLHDASGRLLDLGTKGSGQTPWSRFGDGKLTLRGGVREVLATELLEALGVTTSKSFSLIETGEELVRHDEAPPIRGAVLVRLNHSHIRIGSFQRLLYLEEPGNIARLLDHTIMTYMPDLWRETPAERALAFLDHVCRNVARLGAQWMVAGFVHGVLNTDNINVTGESFDYGPWRFLPVYEPLFTAAYFDETKRYAFSRQPSVLLWNLTRLAECLLTLAPQSALQDTLGTYRDVLAIEFRRNTLRRLGVQPQGDERDEAVTSALWEFMHQSQAPFEQVLFDLYGGSARLSPRTSSPAAAHYRSEPFAPLAAALDAMPPEPGLRLDHAYFARQQPCTLLIDEVDTMLDRIALHEDWSLFHAKMNEIDSVAEAYRVR